ncbi:hypothetical protein JV210_13085 [Plesiomonas shigelloides]|uniref:hypothetical protein n=1 Tax=Plesiomonas shigelloides TaxID=703 RepID=UPI001C05D7CA|nr:hypothetical protein [Plesiomonas shigelloides]QWK94458.1 hypothetical protein JV210_13085 [Plesiomonas shigelloides]
MHTTTPAQFYRRKTLGFALAVTVARVTMSGQILQSMAPEIHRGKFLAVSYGEVLWQGKWYKQTDKPTAILATSQLR